MVAVKSAAPGMVEVIRAGADPAQKGPGMTPVLLTWVNRHTALPFSKNSPKKNSGGSVGNQHKLFSFRSSILSAFPPHSPVPYGSQQYIEVFCVRSCPCH